MSGSDFVLALGVPGAESSLPAVSVLRSQAGMSQHGADDRFVSAGCSLACAGGTVYRNGSRTGFRIWDSARADMGEATWLPDVVRKAAPAGTAPVRYLVVDWSPDTGQLQIFTDPVRSVPVYYGMSGSTFVCASDPRLIFAAGLFEKRVDDAAIYHFLNFSYVPTPHSAYSGLAKMPAGSCLSVERGSRPELNCYWQPRFPEDLGGGESELTGLLESEMTRAIESTRPAEGRWGTFLSGGTDSSSIAGVLARAQGEPVTSISIAFDEPGYDEQAYAKIAADAFGLDWHHRVVSADDTLELIPTLVDLFAEPYGNSSAVPTYYCAQEGRRLGLDTMLAGDGGDEVFGGNERYAKDVIYGWYATSPAVLRRGVSGALQSLGGFGGRFGNKLRNFAARGAMPNPDRFYMDDSFASDYFDRLLDPGFRARCNRDASVEIMREIYGRCDARSEVHRLMFIDFYMAIVDNDLTKVNGTARASGVDVNYPYLSPRLIDFVGRLPGKYKVKGLDKRYLFKKAMSGVLPAETLAKKKQGFGLPVGVWFRRDRRYRELLNDTLRSQRARERGYFDDGFLGWLIERHESGQWDHTQDLWMLLMLELWFRSQVDV